MYIHCDILVCVGAARGVCSRCNPNRRTRRDLANLNGNVKETSKKVEKTSTLIRLTDEREGISTLMIMKFEK